MSSLCYRRATIADVALLAAFNQQLQIDEAHRHRMSLAELEPRMTGWLEIDGYQSVIFERDNTPAGYALFRRDPEHIYLKQFFVCRHLRRQGIGRLAIRWLIENIWKDEPAVVLDVLVNNSAGIAFWQAVGFREYCVTMEFKLAKLQ